VCSPPLLASFFFFFFSKKDVHYSCFAEDYKHAVVRSA